MCITEVQLPCLSLFHSYSLVSHTHTRIHTPCFLTRDHILLQLKRSCTCVCVCMQYLQCLCDSSEYKSPHINTELRQCVLYEHRDNGTRVRSCPIKRANFFFRKKIILWKYYMPWKCKFHSVCNSNGKCIARFHLRPKCLMFRIEMSHDSCHWLMRLKALVSPGR